MILGKIVNLPKTSIRDYIHISFSSKLWNGPLVAPRVSRIHLGLMSEPNKLECYIALDWKSFPGTNTLAY
jgi:hypothetical protein